MAIDISGCEKSITAGNVMISISPSHPLIKLGNLLPWNALIAIVCEDLKKTTRHGRWQVGRKIFVRIHLAVYILQKIFNLTDRQAEYQVRDNAAYQFFCGKNLVFRWQPPDHTKIETFRNRLSPETQRLLANEYTRIAVSLGYGDPGQVDIDSTVQEANMAYPSDARLLQKLAEKAKKIAEYLKKHVPSVLPKVFSMDLRTIKNKAKQYYFLAKNKAIEVKREVFSSLHMEVKKQLYPLIEICTGLKAKTIKNMPWNIRNTFKQLSTHGRRYLLDVAHFIRNHTIKPGKKLAFHLKNITCIKKGKAGKECEFGRVFQLGRILGNFLFVGKNTSLRMEDAESLLGMVGEHSKIFGQNIGSLSTDKKYFSQKNIDALLNITDISLGYQMQGMSDQAFGKLRDRRAGIEPLIGHTKHGGQLGKSRMKSDQATLAAGYAAVGGFNLRQLIRHQKGKYQEAA